MSFLIQFNEGISAFHIDDEAVGGFIALHPNCRRTIKIVFVASNNSSSCRKTIKSMTKGLFDTKRPVCPDQHVTVWLQLVRSGLCTMHILGAGETGTFLQSGLFHGVITLFKDNEVEPSPPEMRVSFLFGMYEAMGKCPSRFQDPDGGVVDTLKTLVFGEPAVLASKVDAERKSEAMRSLCSVKRTRNFEKIQRMLQKPSQEGSPPLKKARPPLKKARPR